MFGSTFWGTYKLFNSYQFEEQTKQLPFHTWIWADYTDFTQTLLQLEYTIGDLSVGNPRQNDLKIKLGGKLSPQINEEFANLETPNGLSQWKGWRWLGGGFSFFFLNFHPYFGKWSILTNIFQMGWNHQLDDFNVNRNLSKQTRDLIIW